MPRRHPLHPEGAGFRSSRRLETYFVLHSGIARLLVHVQCYLVKVRGIDADIDVRVCGGSGGDRYCLRQRDAGWHARDLDRANRHRYAKSCRPQRSLRRPP